MMTKQSKMYAAGGKLKMVKDKSGEEVPFFAADGEGKMQKGGIVPKTKGYFKGGKVYGSSTGTPTQYSPKPGSSSTKTPTQYSPKPGSSSTGTPIQYSPKPGGGRGGRGRGGKRGGRG